MRDAIRFLHLFFLLLDSLLLRPLRALTALLFSRVFVNSVPTFQRSYAS